MPVKEAWRDVAQQPACGRLVCIDPQDARRTLSTAAYGSQHVIKGPQGGLKSGKEAGTRVGRRNAASRAMKQANVQVPFEPSYSVTKG